MLEPAARRKNTPQAALFTALIHPEHNSNQLEQHFFFHRLREYTARTFPQNTKNARQKTENKKLTE